MQQASSSGSQLLPFWEGEPKPEAFMRVSQRKARQGKGRRVSYIIKYNYKINFHCNTLSDRKSIFIFCQLSSCCPLYQLYFSNPRSCIALSYHVFLVTFYLEKFLSLFLALIHWIIFKTMDPLFLKISINLVLSDAFLWLDPSDAFFWKEHDRIIYSS